MRTSFLWLEVTGRCQLECRQCYAESGPSGTHGSMTRADWTRVLDEAAALGVETVQFIGGEPTLYPHLALLVEHALALRFGVEVFSNLVHVTDELWELFSRPGVSLATSYYSDDPAQHAAVTGRPSYARTKANIAEALGRGIPLRAGVIDLGGGQRADDAQRELVELGVPAVGYDRVRQVGRGVRDRQAGVEQLCGHCGDGVAAISPDGAVWPCVFSRWLPVGNVLDDALAAILSSGEAERVRAELTGAFAARQPRGDAGASGGRLDSCHPSCAPEPCQPTCAPRCSPSCSPCAPFRRCWPTYR
ncbi:Radical SAM superfamily enzyme, MoaA/NifB/PqqE/SkfB family [Amycolatopsis rubida]|uniref:Radical SAM superfamily enzyme, MoaA/NifB/PqqE/SkfB family n=1 Tax=Amycolatopsis rubida TaxID=112413 RepID=A0A1I6BME8_9PSEU|nr:Radical SAM superfamily enzyme, MoaA/NifB/PqqE/SkfB family [Amycolatopsis rubida]